MIDQEPAAETLERAETDPWAADRLNRKERAEAFTNLVTSDIKAKVISIEAGFGEGKTFFRKAWANDLRRRGETVIEFDAWKTDYSDDPLISFVGTLMRALPKSATKTNVKKVANAVGKIASVGAKSILKTALKEGAEELIEAVGESSAGMLADKETVAAIEKVAKSAGDAMSKTASAAIVTQLAAERTRTQELPTQLENLRVALQPGKDSGRIIVLIDELDRCRPDYAISLLEAIKHLFDQPGYIFVLMVNAEQLERTAASLFGKIKRGEPYFAKFVDVRLSLGLGAKARSGLIDTLCDELPYVSWNDDIAFSIDRMKEIGVRFSAKLNARQIKSAFLNVDLAMRCFGERPLDGPLLVYLALERCEKRLIGVQTPPTGQEKFIEAFPYLHGFKNFDELQRQMYRSKLQNANQRSTDYTHDLRRIGVLTKWSNFTPTSEDIPELKRLDAVRKKHQALHQEALTGAVELRTDEH